MVEEAEGTNTWHAADHWRVSAILDAHRQGPGGPALETFKHAADWLPALCWVADGTGYVLWYNKACRDYCGAHSLETREWGWQSVLDPVDLPGALDQWRAAIVKGTAFEIISRIRGADGNYRPFLTRARPVKDEAGTVWRWIGISSEMGDQKAVTRAIEQVGDGAQHAEAALRASIAVAKADAERVRLALAAGAIIGTWVWEVNSDQVSVDENFARAFGLTDSAITEGLSLQQSMETVHPDDRPGLMKAIQDALRKGGAYAHQYRVQRQDQRYYWVEANGRVELDEHGNACRFPGILLDLEGRKNLETGRARSEAMLRSFIETTPGTVFAKDRDGRFLMVNKAACEALGAAAEDLIGKNEFEYIGDTPQAYAIRSNDQRIMTTGVPEQVEEELILPDGTLGVFLAYKSPLLDENGAIIGLVGTSFDITERKRSEEREHLLAREVDHRAKNLLAVVQSVVRLTRADTKEEFANAIFGRLDALSRAHTLLADAKWEGADLHRIIRDELAPYEGKIAALLIDGPELRVKASAAQALALVIHELATNAAKYGAFSQPTGSLEVRWWRSGTARDELVISWNEKGGPEVAAPTRKGFGSTMIRASVERQLRGKAHFDWHVDGLRAMLHLSMPEIMDLEQGSRHPHPATLDVPDVNLLTGLNVLIVEDESLIAISAEQALKEVGCNILGPALSLEEGFHLFYKAEQPADVALLDVNLGRDRILPLATALESAGVPIVFQTGVTSAPDLQSRFRSAPIIGKPAMPNVLLGALCRALESKIASPKEQPPAE